VDLTRPVSAAERSTYRATGAWSDEPPIGVAAFEANGERTAIVDRRGMVTYAGLASETERMAGCLRALAVGSGDDVVVVTDNDCQSIIATYAVWRLGAVPLLVQKSAGASHVEFACRACSPALVLLADSAAHLRGAASRAGRGVEIIGDLDGTGRPGPAAGIDPDAARLVIFTSGTTSTPKGVVHTANTLSASASNYCAMTDLDQDERFFLVSPIASIAGVLQALALAPALGAAVVLENEWDPDGTFAFLEETRGTFYGGTDNVLARLFQVARLRGASVPLRAVAVGGTMLRRSVLDEAEERFGICVLRVYGSSEAPNSTGARPLEPPETRLADDGLPAPGVEARIAVDGSGEVLIRGPHVFRGYLDPADNEGAFEGDWFRTGDTGEVVEGRLRVVGRLKEVANRNGRKVSLAEVEEAFLSVAPVDECAAFGVDDDITGERVVLAVHPRDGEPLDVPAALEAMAASGLAKWKLPESVLVYPTPFPVTATGKVQRRALSEAVGTVIWRAERLGSTPPLG
jgi:acyl-CoA synthetase (AMP-forming)/AMP-acid ligase II